ncbi:PIN domain-containing protein [Eubacterium sp.]|uniref:PIN domain-containing protein n=1 Tax=Eubacterium sp. TaxID=142586 RepID=UPI003522B650
METYYLIDFENVHNEGIANIKSMTKTDHMHIFSTQNATNINKDVFWINGDIKSHLVPAKKQSLDMHLVSYLGYLLGIHGKDCCYVIISKDKDYDNIVKFWKEEGYQNISRKEKLPGNEPVQKKTKQASSQPKSNSQTANGRISAGMAYKLDGKDRCELNIFIQHNLVNRGYDHSSANRICKYVVTHCNDERMLSGIHNDIKKDFENYSDVYGDIKSILEDFVQSKNKDTKRESRVRSFFGQHFKKKVYTDCKEEIIQTILNAESKQQVNNGLFKLYTDGEVVSHIYKVVQPLIKELPGK